MIHDAAAAVKRRLHGPDRGITGLLYLLGERTEKNESSETDAVVANRDHALCKRRQMRQRGGDNRDDYENQPARLANVSMTLTRVTNDSRTAAAELSTAAAASMMSGRLWRRRKRRVWSVMVYREQTRHDCKETIFVYFEHRDMYVTAPTIDGRRRYDSRGSRVRYN